MKKDIYLLAGIAALLVTGLLLGGNYYLSQQRLERELTSEKKPATDNAILLHPDCATKGSADAKVTIVEFFDPECESCRAIYPVVKQLMEETKGKTRLVLRYMPFHPNSFYASSALEAAGEQGKYWEMLEILFQNQPVWGSHAAPKPELIPGYALKIGLNRKTFEASMKKPEHRLKIERDNADGNRAGVIGTPTFFVNGRQLEDFGYAPFKALIDEELAK